MLSLFLTAALTATVAQAPKPAANLKCPVLGNPTDAKSETVVVNGQTYRVCCSMCGPMMKADPGKYLNKDGTPKNAK
jgi:hypothetical protein